MMKYLIVTSCLKVANDCHCPTLADQLVHRPVHCGAVLSEYYY